MKTSKDILTEEDILKIIKRYEITEVPRMDKLWEYYKGKNTKILGRKITDPNNPDNRIAVSYGRKIINTFVGYAYRPRFTKYKPLETKQSEQEKKDEGLIEKAINFIKKPFEKATDNQVEKYYKQIQDNFNINNEHIKTSRAGRNIAIFGIAYEVVYIDTQVTFGEQAEIINNNIPKFFSVDPREMILLYDYSPEPKKKIAVRFYKTEEDEGRVEVYYKDHIEEYKRINKDTNGNQAEEKLVLIQKYINFFDEVNVVAYYFGDEMMGLIEPVMDLIDAYDVLLSDSMNEFDRFAFAYLIMKKFGLTDLAKKTAPGMVDKADATIKNLKKKRVFEHLPEGADISFLTKDIPTEFIQFMSELLKNQIHIQSHVPDFNMMTGALSGAAVDRLLFDFENIVSSAEADFDVGLTERIDLITVIYVKSKKGVDGRHEDIVISHKRNLPQNNQEYADLAVKMKTAGFSRFAIADMMPDDLIPDVDKELQRQDEDMEAMLPDIENMGFGNEDPNTNKPDVNTGDEEDSVEEE
jgi:SPP1 family phage portal protein